MGKKKKFDTLLEKCILTKTLVKLEREVVEGEADIAGFILDKSDQFLLVQQVEEFDLNGYAIIRKDHFSALRANEFDEVMEQILKEEGILKKKYGLKKTISLDSWTSMFETLKKKDFHVIVECEDLEEPTFTIGPVTKVGKNSVQVHFYDAIGVYDKKPTKIKFEDITLVRFGDRYSTIFRKYAVKG